MHPKAICAALLIAASCGAAPADAASIETTAMEQVLNGFYEVHQKSSQDGIPDARQRAKYAPYVSPGLEELLAQADAAQARFAKANPESPPVVEGDLFSPNFEGITSFRARSCAAKASTAQCGVQMHYAAAHPRLQDKSVDWTDKVMLVKTPAGWRVDDIAYGGSWDFGNHGTLKAILKDVIAETAP